VYCIVRKDIPTHQALVQVGHAAFHAGVEGPTKGIPSLIVLQVKNEAELLKAGEYLKSVGIKFEIFYEPDFGPMGYSALATHPLYEDDRHKLKKFQLWKEAK